MSEQLAKLPCISGRLQSYGEDDRIEFYLTLCFDVILEVIRFGDRRQLVKMEGVGRRFHHLVEKWFGEIPFLRLDIRIEHGDALQLVIVGNKRGRISLENLAEFPPFLRFNKVLLLYGTKPSSQPLFAKCILFEYCLNSIKPALKDSNKIHFVASINHADPSHFSDHSSLAIYLHNRLLPICDSSRRYMFDIVFDSQSADENSLAEVISSILQIPQARTCSNVSIALFYFYVSARLPVENISNWLAPETDDGIELYGKRKENRLLLIFSSIVGNTQEMWEHLKEKFYDDERPAIPFTLRIEGEIIEEIIEEQKLSNRKTNEELSILPYNGYKCLMGAEIKRTTKQKRNSQPKP